MPSTVINIGKLTFQGCTSLNKITFENDSKLKFIDDYAFFCCISLKEITIPSSVASIGISAFEECISLSQVTIENTKTIIGKHAFKGCRSLTNETREKLKKLTNLFDEIHYINK